MNYFKVLITGFLFFYLGKSNAQESQSFHAWNALFTSYSLTTSTSLMLETHYRTKNFYATQEQVLIRPSIRRKISENTMLSGGYTHIATGLDDQRITENNLWEQLFFRVPIFHRVSYFGWIRAEHRWIRKGGTSFVTRLRFRNGLTVPVAPLKLDLLIYNETFLNFSDSFPAQLNQNWSYIGFRKAIARKLHLQSGLQRASIPKNGGITAKNIWFTILFWEL